MTIRLRDNQPGVLASLPPIAYAGRVNCITGYGAAARHQIWALRQHGARLKIVDAGSDGDPDPARKSEFVQSCRTSPNLTQNPKASIIHLGPHCTAKIRRQLPRPHILVSVWETDRLPATWVPIISSFDQVWCATQWQADVYIKSGVTSAKVRVVSFALDPALYPEEGPCLPEMAAFKAQGYKVFGSMFQWSERKAPRALIGAFLAAFHRGEKVVLFLKAYEGTDAKNGVAHHVAALIRSHQTPSVPKVEVISRRMSHDETLAFYRGLDCYVSAHRGEGYGLGIAESLLIGRPVIATDWSAPAEYAHLLYMPVSYSLEAPHSMEWQPFYSVDQRWASPSQTGLVMWMRRVYEGQAEYDRGLVLDRFSRLMQQAGDQAFSALSEVMG